jgi:signal peptidase II
MMKRPDPRLLLISGSVAALVVVASWVVRVTVERQLALSESISLIGAVLHLSRGENSGVAFGLLRGSSVVPWLSAVAVVFIALVAAQQRSTRASVAAGLILGGGVANAIDRIGDRRVTDYIDVALGTWRYPTFNLPDVSVTLGAGLLLVAFVMDDLARQGRVASGAQAEMSPMRKEGS